MEAILLRGDHEKNFTCTPKIATLVSDTRNAKSTIKKAIATLRDLEYLRVQYRGYGSNRYWVSWERILAESEAFQQKLKQEKEARKEAEIEMPSSGPHEDDNTDFLDADSDDGPTDVQAQTQGEVSDEEVDSLFDCVQCCWSTHESFEYPDELRYHLANCIKIAGGVEIAKRLVLAAESHLPTRTAVANSANLGTYLTTCLRNDWPKKFKKGGK